MYSPFTQTLRSLEADGPARWRVGLLGGGAVLVAWTGWFFLARVTIYEVSQSAQLASAELPERVSARIEGQVASVDVRVGDLVEADQVLVELRADATWLDLEQAWAEERALSGRLEALEAGIVAAAVGLEQSRGVGQASLGEAAERLSEAEAEARQTAIELTRVASLHGDGHVSDEVFERARVDAEQAAANARALRNTVQRSDWEGRRDDSDRLAAVEDLRNDKARLEGELEVLAAQIGRLELEVERHRIRAPAAGRLIDLADIEPGEVVAAGTPLGTVLPLGSLKVVAQLAPASALGRVHTGQAARLRLDGFPWAQYGALDCQVRRVAGEPRDGTLRVELDLVSPEDSAVPLQHALAGTVEITIERVSPAILTLRAAGRALSGGSGGAPDAAAGSGE